MEEGFLSVQNIDLLHHVAIWKTFSSGKASCIVQFTFDRISLSFFLHHDRFQHGHNESPLQVKGRWKKPWGYATIEDD